MAQKLNILLGAVKHSEERMKNSIKLANQEFSTKAFADYKKTYEPLPGEDMDENEVNNPVIIPKVMDVLKQVADKTKSYLTDKLTIETSNSKGAATVDFIVDGYNYGPVTSLVLLRLKDFLANDKGLAQMINKIKTLDPTKSWDMAGSETEFPGYFCTRKIESVKKRVETDYYIPVDPNIQGKELPAHYQAKSFERKRYVECANTTSQCFSGEVPESMKKAMLQNIESFKAAVDKYLDIVNDVESTAPTFEVSAFVDNILQIQK